MADDFAELATVGCKIPMADGRSLQIALLGDLVHIGYVAPGELSPDVTVPIHVEVVPWLVNALPRLAALAEPVSEKVN